MASISRPSLFSFPQLFGLLVVLGGSEPKPEPKTNVLIRCSNPTKQEKEKKRKEKKGKKIPETKKKPVIGPNQSFLLSPSIKQFKFFLSGVFFSFQFLILQNQKHPLHKTKRELLKPTKNKTQICCFVFLVCVESFHCSLFWVCPRNGCFSVLLKHMHCV